MISANFLLALEKEAATPFRLTTLIIFILAICHTFFANHFTMLAERLAEKHKKKPSFAVEALRFLGEVEIIFALWVIPLLFAICFFYDSDTAIEYLNSRPYLEPTLVVVVMTLAASRPILRIVEGGLWLIAQVFGGSLLVWWFTILTIGPLLGSFITEVGAMTICAYLLLRKLYVYNPNKKIAYATLGLLFVNISVGGVLTTFAAPPVLILAGEWDWDSWYLITTIGWKAIIGVIICNIAYFLFLRKDLMQLAKAVRFKEQEEKSSEERRPVPYWITAVHIFFIVWVVINAHYPAVFIGSFLLFLGFHQATAAHQSPLLLRKPLLVGMFLAGLIIHGGLQGWWIAPVLGNVSDGMMMLATLALSPFNDNAAIAYLATLIPHPTEDIKYAIIAGVIAGGGLTVIANAPNPAGQMILRKYFKSGISPLKLFVAALLPTLIYLAVFFLL